MNLTSIASIPNSQNWKRVRGQTIATAAGLALAVSAVIAFGPSGSTSNPATPVRQAAMPSVNRQAEAPQHFFIIAADAAQKAQLEAADSELRALDPGRSDITVLVAGSREAELLQTEGVRELTAYGARFTLSDFSRPLQLAVAPKAADSDIMASVLSTELATWESSSSLADPMGRVALDAAIMASVISTERAAYGE